MSMNREQFLAKNKRRKEVITLDFRLLEACHDLRYRVEHPDREADIIMAGGLYRHKDPERIWGVKVDGVEIGYKVAPCSPLEINPYFDRYVYIRTPGYRMRDLSEMELAALKFAVLETFFQQQQGEIKVEIIGEGALLLWQRFMVIFPYKYQNATVQVPLAWGREYRA